MSKNEYNDFLEEWKKFSSEINETEKKEIDNIFDDYLDKIKKNNLELKKYSNQRSITDYFCNFIENTSASLYGSAKPGNAKNYGLYMNKSGDYVQEEIFFEIKTYLTDLVTAESIDDIVELEQKEDRPIRANQMLKKLIAYKNMGKFLFIYSDDAIDAIYDSFIENNQLHSNIKKNYLLTEELLKILKINNPNNEDMIKLSKFIWKKFEPIVVSNELNLFKNIIYHGAPGTGKTYELKKEIDEYLELYENGKSEFIQFHSSYYYEDFIGGLKPNPKSENGLSLEFRNGIFKELCREAGKYEVAYYTSDDYKDKKDKVKFSVDENKFEIDRKKPDFSQFPPYFILIDEINRADLSKVFGELLFAIEDDYRGYENRFKLSTSLMENKETAVCWENNEALFFVPKNLYIRGTMNDIDRSVDSIDFAFRRRFKWVAKNYDEDILREMLLNFYDKEDEKIKKYIKFSTELNKKIIKDISVADKSYEIGHAIFRNIVKYAKAPNNIRKESKGKLFDNHIEPIIYNYLKMDYGNEGSDIKAFRDEFIK